MERHSDKLVDIIDSEFGLLNILLENEVLSSSEIGRIKVKPSRYEKNEMLLFYIANTNKQKDFLAALRESSQTHVANWIIADGKFKEDEYGLDWPLTDRENKILNMNQRKLVEILDTCDLGLLNRMYSEGIITSWHKELIESKPTHHDKNEALLEIVRRLSLKAYSKLTKCLRDSNQRHIAEIFEFGGVIVPVHATFEGDNLSEAETQIVNAMTDFLRQNTSSNEQANRLIAELHLNIIGVKRGDSIVLFIGCSKEEDFNHLCKVVDNMVLKEKLEQLVGLLLPNLKTTVMAVKLFERDIAKAKESFARRSSSDKTESIKYMHLEDTHSKNGKEIGDIMQINSLSNLESNLESSILKKGMTRSIQKNVFNENFTEVTNSVISRNIPVSCSLCEKTKGINEIFEATMRCLNCCEKYCLPCSESHKSENATKDHIIVDLKRERIEEKVRNTFSMENCNKHSGKVLGYYCSDCRSVVCDACFAECHKTHNCKYVASVDEYLYQKLEKIVAKINYCRRQISSRLLDMETQNREFSEKTLEIKNFVHRKSQQMKTLIERHTQEVLYELAFVKQKRQKQMETEMNEMLIKSAMFEGFAIRCDELRTKGSSGVVCDDAAKSIERAEEFSNEIEEYLNEPRISVDLRFTATDENTLLQNVTNVIGKVSEFVPQFESCAFVMSANTGDSMASNVIKIDLNRPGDVFKIEPIPTRVPFGVAAVVDCYSIFVTGTGENCNEIWKFDSTSSKWMKCASLVQGRQLHMVAFVANVLFICGGYVKPSRKALDHVESYDGRNDKCVSVGKLVHAVRNSGNCVPFKTSLYIFGGCDENHRIVRNVQVYNTELNSCTLLETLIPRDECLLRAVRWENTAILLGSSTCLVYRFDTGTWQVNDQFKAGDVHFGLALNKDKLFVIGGGLQAYALKNAVKWIPVANILNDEPSEWRHHAYLPKPSSVYDFVCGEME